MAVDLVDLMLETAKENHWKLVLVVPFTRWQNALAIPDAEVAYALDKKGLGYIAYQNRFIHMRVLNLSHS